MKLSVLIAFSLSLGATAFAPAKSAPARTSQLNAAVERRTFVAGLATVAAASVPLAANAYSPEYKDIRQIYGLGVSLDKLLEKVSDPDKFDAALDGLVAFNRDPDFFVGYARNFIGKVVKNNAIADPRNGYIRQASNLIGSCQGLLEGREGLTGKAASDEAVKRVKEAQNLVAKFLAESGVEDEKVQAFVAAHP
uniref:Uncharacterized protein n=1 Tax=Trieres chinensis TaxID=1514140 RepID=A0A7S1ZYX6_TRICV|mmetsp:Transcript_36011/g.73596  ORF Transcript_36011/g.73596 Transcript_36011/m.73596 type:complete len:194 (+) Transcript_36011:80-661(+)|eukprot:CAMPEP_0183296478 /NCGR_PEP_ID=MMETSP0160_2-20130417/4014_1 /TAXON_ID=2839 ORGANISM="Odontella Sinensis, Strain Grunow 1884" /NCGR_SAMPLE_ID=MMETSP0160_2 /ASSEMBLY_ACC=CAM_ASM_000250 /LENGTH=193 /DNA_ID=CAMNT_0025458093 /DNA_START=66 /DNA_END=647 /DNA_ORIENTATION=+